MLRESRMEIIISAKHYKNEGDEPEQEIKEQTLLVHKDFILQVIPIIAKDLDISNLKSIIIPENFKEELSSFQKENNLPVEMTDNEHGVCKGKTMNLKDGSESAVIFLDKECLLYYAADNIIQKIPYGEEIIATVYRARSFWVNTLHHELCHVDERNKRKSISWLQNRRIDPAEPFDRYLDLAMILFEEYYACRKSSGTHFILGLDTNNLVDEVRIIESEIFAKRTAYNDGKISLESFFQFFVSYSRLLLTRVAYALGNYYCVDDDKRKEQYNWLSDKLDGTNAGEILHELDMALNNLYEVYPQWENENVLEDLADLVGYYYLLFRITLHNHGESLFISIPPLD